MNEENRHHYEALSFSAHRALRYNSFQYSLLIAGLPVGIHLLWATASWVMGENHFHTWQELRVGIIPDAFWLCATTPMILMLNNHYTTKPIGWTSTSWLTRSLIIFQLAIASLSFFIYLKYIGSRGKVDEVFVFSYFLTTSIIMFTSGLWYQARYIRDEEKGSKID